MKKEVHKTLALMAEDPQFKEDVLAILKQETTKEVVKLKKERKYKEFVDLVIARKRLLNPKTVSNYMIWLISEKQREMADLLYEGLRRK